jgi:hypothetical protein
MCRHFDVKENLLFRVEFGVNLVSTPIEPAAVKSKGIDVISGRDSKTASTVVEVRR